MTRTFDFPHFQDLFLTLSYSGIAYEDSAFMAEICWLRRVTSGGVVSAPYFLDHFGLINADGSKNTAKIDAVSSNVVSVLQAGAFFGALGSASLSGKNPNLGLSIVANDQIAKFGRKYTLFGFSIIFCIGAVSPWFHPLLDSQRLTFLQVLTTAASGSGGLAEIYAGRIISGVGIGAISAVAPAYVAECSPKEVRGRITGLFQLMVRSYRSSYTVGNLFTESF